jgi:hypothetical protein
MNWRIGLFRFWIVASAIWMAAVAWYFRESIVGECPPSYVLDAKLYVVCELGISPWGLFEWRDLLAPLGLVTLPPLAMLTLGALVFWIASGFKARSAN